MSDNDCVSRKWVDRELLEERLHNICRNTCQYAKKGVRPNVMCPLCWLDDIFKSIDELAVEQPMSAVEYVDALERMFVEDHQVYDEWYDVMLADDGDVRENRHKEVSIVEAWAKEHPERSEK